MSIPTDRARAILLASAIGDALGWPFELPKRVVGQPVRRGGFYSWRRVVGARRWRFEEQLRAGSYSDDTQLLLATGRSLLRGDQWFRHLVELELPTWALYERGGGRQTKAAVRAWTAGRAPWRAGRDDRRRYFEGGGNGGAMRIAPHAIVGGESWLHRVVADTAATHGHGRALIGSTLHAWVIRAAALGRTTSETLLSDAVAATGEWGDPSLLGVLPDEWNQAHPFDPRRSWDQAVSETIELLQRAQGWRDQGAVVADGEVMDDLGALGASRGAGHIGAVCAAYMASRYASQPTVGLESIARLDGADTDTVASMTGAVFGGLVGLTPFAGWLEDLQDRAAIEELAEVVSAAIVKHTEVIGELRPAPKGGVDRFKEQVWDVPVGNAVELPDGRMGEIFDRRTHESAESAEIVGHYVRLDDGQGIAVVTRRAVRPTPLSQSRPAKSQEDATAHAGREATAGIAPPGVHVRLTFAVSRWETLLELLARCEVAVSHDVDDRLELAGVLTLERRGSEPQAQLGLDTTAVVVSLTVDDLAAVVAAAKDLGVASAESPDGVIIEAWDPVTLRFLRRSR